MNLIRGFETTSKHFMKIDFEASDFLIISKFKLDRKSIFFYI